MKKAMPIFLVLALLILTSFTACSNETPSAPPISDPSGTTATTAATKAMLTVEEAEAIALEHAGFTADQVTGLRTELDYDDGVTKYEVQFRVDRVEYNYDIAADSGEILSFETDDVF